MKIVSKIVIICCLVLFISFYVCTDAKGAVCGDIDGDGDVDCDDAVLVYDYVSGYGFFRTNSSTLPISTATEE